MKLILAIICDALLFLIGVDSRPENLSHQEGSVRTQDVQIKIDENWAELLQRLSTLQSNFSGVTDPKAKEEFKRRSEAFETEISAVSQDIYHEALKVCLGSDTFPGDIVNCSRNPMSYITEKFTSLNKKLEEFEVENLSYLSKDKVHKKENWSLQMLSKEEGLVTSQDVDKKAFENMLKILRWLSKLVMGLDVLIKPPFKEEITSRFKILGDELIEVFVDILHGAMRECVGSDIIPENATQCYRNPMNYIKERYASLHKRTQEIVVEIMLYLDKANALLGANWSLEELLNQEDIITTLVAEKKKSTIENLDYVFQWTILQFLKVHICPDLREKLKTKFDTFLEEIIALRVSIIRRESCEESDSSSGRRAPCYRNPKEYITETFTPLYKKMKQFEEESRPYLI